jgi:hypothetical protein
MRRRATAGFILLAFLGPILGMRVHAQNARRFWSTVPRRDRRLTGRRCHLSAGV